MLFLWQNWLKNAKKEQKKSKNSRKIKNGLV
jgi:hypothetical protein